MSKLGTRMFGGVSQIFPGHFTPSGTQVYSSDSLTIADTAVVSGGAATDIVVSDSLTLVESTVNMAFTDTDSYVITDTANANALSPVGGNGIYGTSIYGTATYGAAIGTDGSPVDTSAVLVAVLPGVTPPRLPRVHHIFSSEAGVDYPPVSAWFAEETAPGGFGAAGGTVESSRVHDQPGIYTPGATWQMWTEDGFLLWEGVLSNAIMHDGSAELVGRGWAFLAERDAGRLLFMTHPDMVAADSDPFNINISDSYEIDASGSRIAFIGRAGETINAGNKTGAVFWAEGAELTSVAMNVDYNGQGLANQSVYIQTGVGPSPQYTDLREEGGKVRLDAGAVDRRLNATRNGDLIMLELRRDQSTGSGGLPSTVKVTIHDTRVRGLAHGDDMSYAAVAREVASRLGVDDSGVRDTGDNVLPLDWTDGSFAELLDYGATVSATRWLIRSVGNGPVMEVDEWDAERWYTQRGDGSTDLVPIGRYNSVVVAYPTHNGRHRTHTVTANDLDMADPFAATGYSNAFHVEIDQKQADSDLAQSIGVKLLSLLITERMSGSLQRAFLEGPTGHLQPAYRAKAGSTITVSDGLPGASIAVRVSRKRSTPQGVSFELDDRIAELDSFLERRSKRISVKS